MNVLLEYINFGGLNPARPTIGFATVFNDIRYHCYNYSNFMMCIWTFAHDDHVCFERLVYYCILRSYLWGILLYLPSKVEGGVFTIWKILLCAGIGNLFVSWVIIQYKEVFHYSGISDKRGSTV